MGDSRMAEKRGNIWVKYIAVTVLFLSAFLGSGCGNEREETKNGETTELFSGAYTMSPAGVLRVDDHGYLQFYSRESGSTIYLCNQAGCSHQDKNCSAYVEGIQTAFYFNDDLYFVQFLGGSQTQIMRANRYGENRQILGEMDVFPIPFSLRIYEGILYFIGDKWEFGEGESTHTEGLYTFRLSDGTFTALTSVDTGYRISNVSDFLVTDQYIYTQYSASDVDINDYFDVSTGELQKIDWDSIVYTYLLYRTDRQTGETELLMKEEGGDEVGVTILEANGESFIVRLYNNILRYEGEELAEVLYTYSGDKEYWQVKPLGDGYLVSEGMAPCQFHILENFTEMGMFGDAEENVNCFYGSAGDTLYFGGNYTLYYMEWEDFKRGDYDFHLIDID